MSGIVLHETAIPGLLLVDLVVHGDSRGYFKENWQQQKFVEAGLVDFTPVQHNIAFNADRGTTRGIHAEPWNKLISVATGSVFVAIVDLRDQNRTTNKPTVATFTLDENQALYIPKGCGNSYQTLEPNVVYSYLVDAHWSIDAHYKFVNLADPTLAIDWPIALQDSVISDKDMNAPNL